MKKLGKNIEYLVANLVGDSEQARINIRASQVRERYREVMKVVYPEAYELFLAHTNNVYIMKKDGIPTLIVYVDDSIFSAELNAQRELIKLKLLELFGEQIEDFSIYVSRGSYKKNHPFSEEPNETNPKAQPLIPLESHERQSVETVSSVVEDKKLRETFEKAMTADLARKKTEKGKTS